MSEKECGNDNKTTRQKMVIDDAFSFLKIVGDRKA